MGTSLILSPSLAHDVYISASISKAVEFSDIFCMAPRRKAQYPVQTSLMKILYNATANQVKI